MNAPRLLVVEGNPKIYRERSVASGGTISSESYAALLRRLAPAGTVVDICYPADPGANLPGGAELADYDGIAVTGSALNVYDGGAAIEPQIELMRAAFRTPTPSFGSCWGLQIAAVAGGGAVRQHPKGREIGFGRRITIADAGQGHRLFLGKPRLFDAITVHHDDVETLAPGMTILATNAWSPVQAAEMTTPGGGGFWGVQYHPEYDLAEIAAIFRRYRDVLITQGLFPDMAAQIGYAAELDALHADPADPALTWRYGLDETVLDPDIRSLEIRNWVEQIVLPTRSARGRG